MSCISGRHRQRTTGRLLTYVAFYDGVDGTAEFIGDISDEDAHGIRDLASTEGFVRYDPAEMSADEAVRQEMGRFIDRTEFGEGKPRPPRAPNWTDFGPYK